MDADLRMKRMPVWCPSLTQPAPNKAAPRRNYCYAIRWSK